MLIEKMLFGISSQLIQSADCVYPFDVSPAELVSIGYNPYPLHDECYNKFSWDGSGTGNYAAAKKEAFEFFVSGIVPDSAKIPLPNSLGTAIEYRIKFPSDDNESSFPILNAAVFDIPSGGVHSGGGIYSQQNSAMNRNLIVFGQGDTNGSPISVPQEISEITVSVLYKTDGTMDVKTAYGEVLDKTYLLDSFLVLTSEGSTDGEFEVITNAKDLTFPYPEGTKGLDGELIPREIPEPKLDTMTIITGSVPNTPDNIGYNSGDVGLYPYGTIVDHNLEMGGIPQLVDEYEGGLIIRYSDVSIPPTSIELEVNDEVINWERMINFHQGTLVIGLLNPSEDRLWALDEEVSVEILFKYD